MKASKSLTLSYLVYFTFLIIIFSCNKNNSTGEDPILNKKIVLITCGNGYLYSLEANNGNLLWKTSQNNYFSTPVVEGKSILLGGRDGIYCLDIANGAQKWKHTAPWVTNNNPFMPAPMVSNGVAYIAWSDGYIYALDVTNGTLKWKTPALSGKSFSTNVTVSGNLLFAGNQDSLLYCLDKTNGAITWTFLTGGNVLKNPLIYSNMVYTSGTFGNFYALNMNNGNIVWTSSNRYGDSSPFIHNGRLYSGGGSNAWALNPANGAVLWTAADPLSTIHIDYSTGFVANNKFYAGTLDGKLNAYDLSGTTPTWRQMNATSIFSSPLVESNTVYVGAGDRNFYALNADTGVLIWKYRTDGQIVSSACVVGVNNDVYYPNNLGYAN